MTREAWIEAGAQALELMPEYVETYTETELAEATVRAVVPLIAADLKTELERVPIAGSFEAGHSPPRIETVVRSLDVRAVVDRVLASEQEGTE